MSRSKKLKKRKTKKPKKKSKIKSMLGDSAHSVPDLGMHISTRDRLLIHMPLVLIKLSEYHLQNKKNSHLSSRSPLAYYLRDNSC